MLGKATPARNTRDVPRSVSLVVDAPWGSETQQPFHRKVREGREAILVEAVHRTALLFFNR